MARIVMAFGHLAGYVAYAATKNGPRILKRSFATSEAAAEYGSAVTKKARRIGINLGYGVMTMIWTKSEIRQ